MFQENSIEKNTPCVFVIFGGTGDLTRKKLIPALYNLYKAGRLSQNFSVVALGRQDHTSESFRSLLHSQSISDMKSADWNGFCSRLFYYKLDFSTDTKRYEMLKHFLENIDDDFQTQGNRIFYLAVSPNLFTSIVSNLKSHNMIENQTSWQRVMIEKPFGTSLLTAKRLNEDILQVLPEDKIFRIDHYLGKDMVQNIIAIRFSNLVFESLWNRHYIDHIQITLSEQIGIENRGAYYEHAGVLRDMLQNHILQILSLVCMDAPESLDAEAIRDEKVRVLAALRMFDDKTARSDVVLGQYGSGHYEGQDVAGYRDEERVDSASNVPTFVAMKAFCENDRWRGVPIYIRTGKRMDKSVSCIVIQFKKFPDTHCYNELRHVSPNSLVIKIRPSEGILYQINTKVPGSSFHIEKAEMDYCQSCKYQYNSPEAYERIIIEAIRNNFALFTRWDELEYSWAFIETIENALEEIGFDFPNYPAGSTGPKAAAELILRDGREWWEGQTPKGGYL